MDIQSLDNTTEHINKVFIPSRLKLHNTSEGGILVDAPYYYGERVFDSRDDRYKVITGIELVLLRDISNDTCKDLVPYSVIFDSEYSKGDEARRFFAGHVKKVYGESAWDINTYGWMVGFEEE